MDRTNHRHRSRLKVSDENLNAWVLLIFQINRGDLAGQFGFSLAGGSDFVLDHRNTDHSPLVYPRRFHRKFGRFVDDNREDVAWADPVSSVFGQGPGDGHCGSRRRTRAALTGAALTARNPATRRQNSQAEQDGRTKKPWRRSERTNYTNLLSHDKHLQPGIDL